jgi:predicted DCC family thiol-disulfide oxidoreductase YuxK
MDNRHIVVFDGVCNFCNGAVNFIIKRDPHGKFAFTPMQSELGNQLMTRCGVSETDVDTFLLIKGGRCFFFSSAALEIAKDLAGVWPLLGAFRLVPRPIRDAVYKVLARNRYTLFGKRDACMVPSEAVRSRFIGV